MIELKKALKIGIITPAVFFFFLTQTRIDLAKGFYNSFKMVPSVHGTVDELAQLFLSYR